MNEIIINCPHCQQPVSIEEQHYGMELQCPTCNKTFTAPRNKPAAMQDITLKKRIQQEDTKITEQITTCPHCQQSVSIEEQYYGMELQCPTCNKTFTATRNGKKKNASPPFMPVGTNFTQQGDTEYTKSKTISQQDSQPIAQKRQLLANFFETAEGAMRTSWIINILTGPLGIFLLIIEWFLKLISNPEEKITRAFKEIQNRDIPFLKRLDILPFYGKKSSQLVAESYTLFSPAVDYESESDGPDFKYAVKNADDTLLYNLEEVIKICTFEDQLFVFKAYWDYTTGKLFNESTEAFFFKDISDILTKNDYEYVHFKINNDITFQEAAAKHHRLIQFLRLIPIVVFLYLYHRLPFTLIEYGTRYLPGDWWLYLIFALLIAICLFFIIPTIVAFIAYLYEKSKTTKVLVKKSETFIISATSGNSTGITMLCDEWVEAKNGTRYMRTNGEKIIHAIRKMIEEKKVSVNE